MVGSAELFTSPFVSPAFPVRVPRLGVLHKACADGIGFDMLTRFQPVSVASFTGEISKSGFDVSEAPRGGLPTRRLAGEVSPKRSP